MNGVKTNHLRALKLACLFCLLAGAAFTPSRGASVGADDNCAKCHAQSTGRAAEVVAIHRTSAHGKLSVGCADCHGGDPAQTEKAKAHSTNFTGKPDRNATLLTSGACHDPQRAHVKSGKHFPEKHRTTRLDGAV